MTNKKVYCSNCIYLSDEGILVSSGHYNYIRFRTDPNKRICHGTVICTSGMEKKIDIVDGPLSRTKKLIVTVDDPFIRNANNNCIMYKESILPRIIKVLKKHLNIK